MPWPNYRVTDYHVGVAVIVGGNGRNVKYPKVDAFTFIQRYTASLHTPSFAANVFYVIIIIIIFRVYMYTKAGCQN